MKRRARVKIYWLTASEGGRKRPPQGPPGSVYRAPSRFEDEMVSSSGNMWDLVVRFEEFSEDKLELEAMVWFLSDRAPENLLRPGHRFTLFEGPQVVGKGIVLSISESDFDEGAEYRLINYTKRELLSYPHLPVSRPQAIASDPISAALTTWYLLKNSGDQIAFVTTMFDDWPFPGGSKNDAVDYSDVTEVVMKKLVEEEMI